MQVAVYSQVLKEKDLGAIQELFDVLQDLGIAVYIFAPYFEKLNGVIQFKRNVGSFESFLDFKLRKFDFVITLGGDGTILGATTVIRNSEVPIMGINLGRLGFLATIEKPKIKEAIHLMVNGRYEIEDRTLLHLESNEPLFNDIPYALNDFTLLKRDTSSMITIHIFINGAFLNTYWADGIIVATPTGSTGYSLSCGGPIIFPNSGNFVITPVAPHNLNIRPIVISDDSVVSFQVEGRAENFLCTLDSRFARISAAHQLAVRKEDFTIKLVRLNDVGFVETMRSKLAWGADKRNL